MGVANAWKQSSQLALMVLTIAGPSGCGLGTFTAKMYPVEGPTAAHTPQPVYLVQLSAPPGWLTVTLPGPELCTGRWGLYSGSSFLADDWDRIHGAGYYDRNVRGNLKLSRSRLTCNKGSSLEVEIFSAAKRGHYFGIARDQNYNLFKIVFER